MRSLDSTLHPSRVTLKKVRQTFESVRTNDSRNTVPGAPQKAAPHSSHDRPHRTPGPVQPRPPALAFFPASPQS